MIRRKFLRSVALVGAVLTAQKSFSKDVTIPNKNVIDLPARLWTVENTQAGMWVVHKDAHKYKNPAFHIRQIGYINSLDNKRYCTQCIAYGWVQRGNNAFVSKERLVRRLNEEQFRLVTQEEFQLAIKRLAKNFAPI